MVQETSLTPAALAGGRTRPSARHSGTVVPLPARRCEAAITVAVDELTGKTALTCPHCHHTPHGIATRQILHACQASLATSTGAVPGTADPRGRPQ